MTTIESPRTGDVRLQRLSQGVASLRGRGGDTSRDRLLLIAGGIAVPFGLLLILIGWYGAAHTVLPFEQTPFLISGGLLGLAFVFAGGFVYFSYWMTLFVRETRQERERAEARDARVEALLQLAVDSLAAADTAPRTARRPAASGGLVMTSAGTMLHRATCPITARQDVHPAAWDDHLQVCDLCAPERPEVHEIVLPTARTKSRTKGPVSVITTEAAPARRTRSTRVSK